MKILSRLGNWRQILLRCTGWIHCAMVFALFYGAALRLLVGEQTLPWAVWRGLLAVFPFAVADLAAQFSRKLWQFILLSLAACGLSWLLLGTPFAALPTAFLCFLRGKNRLSEEPEESALDRPHILVVVLFILPFLYSALGGGALLQKLCLIWAAIYLLLCGAKLGLERIDRYITLNQNMAGVPVRRIVRTTGLALVGMLVIAGALLLPALAMEDSYLYIDPDSLRSHRKAQVQQEEAQPMDNMVGIPEELQALGEGSSFRIPPIVSYLFFAAIGGGAVVLVLYGAYVVLRNFRGSFVDQRDEVQYLRGPQEEKEAYHRARRNRPALWDRSPNAQVRRRYRRAVLRAAKEEPPQWAAPQEIEEGAGLQDPLLHQLYEKARYSQEGCTAQESRSLKA